MKIKMFKKKLKNGTRKFVFSKSFRTNNMLKNKKKYNTKMNKYYFTLFNVRIIKKRTHWLL